MKSVDLDSFDEDEIEELWCANVNFSEFYLMCKEMFASMYRAMSADIDAEDILVDSLEKLRFR